MIRRVLLSLTVALGLLALSFFVVGALPTSPVASAGSTARVRVVHAVSDAPPVDIAVDGTLVLSDVVFKAVTPYVEVPAGAFTVTVTAPSLGPAPILTETLTAVADHDYTLAAHGTANPSDAYPLSVLVALDDNEVPPVGKARARFFHLVHDIPDSFPVSVRIKNGPVLLSGLRYGDVSDYVEIDMGTYALQLTTGLLSSDPITVTADPNTVYSFFGVGTVSSPDIVQAIDAQYARVRAFHGVSDAPPVDVWLNGDKVFEGLAYKDLTPYGAVMSDTYTLGLAPVGLSVPVLSDTLVLTGGMDFTIAAAGTLTVTDSYPAELLPYIDDNTPPLPGKAQVRLIHLVPDAPAVNVGVTGVVTPLFTAVTYRQATSYAPVDAGVVDLEVTLAGPMGMRVATLPNVLLEEGTITTGFAVGLVAGPAPVEVVGFTQRFTVYLPLVAKGP